MRRVFSSDLFDHLTGTYILLMLLHILHRVCIMPIAWLLYAYCSIERQVCYLFNANVVAGRIHILHRMVLFLSHTLANLQASLIASSTDTFPINGSNYNIYKDNIRSVYLKSRHFQLMCGFIFKLETQRIDTSVSSTGTRFNKCRSDGVHRTHTDRRGANKNYYCLLKLKGGNWAA